MAGFWIPMDDSGANQHYYGANGRNVADILNGKLLVYDQANFNAGDPDVQSMVQKLAPQMGTAQDVSNAINEDAPGNGAGKGSMREGILSTLGAGAAFYGAGGLLSGIGGAGGGASTLGDLSATDLGGGYSSIGQVSGPGADASWGVNPQAGDISGGLDGPAADSFRNPDGSFGSTLANSGPGGSGVAEAVGASGGSTPWMQAPTFAESLASSLRGGGTPSGTGTAATAGSAISRILDGTATTADYLSVGGAALPGVLGAITSNQQASKLSDLAQQYSNYGAPSRARYEASFQPGFTMASDPGYQDALDSAGKTTLHALSVNGNPADSPNAWAASQKDLYDKTAYPALQAYRNTNSVGGGLASGASAAPDLATKAIAQTGTTMADLGGAAKDVFAPTSTIDDLLKKLKGAGNIFAVQ